MLQETGWSSPMLRSWAACKISWSGQPSPCSQILCKARHSVKGRIDSPTRRQETKHPTYALFRRIKTENVGNRPIDLSWKTYQIVISSIRVLRCNCWGSRTTWLPWVCVGMARAQQSYPGHSTRESSVGVICLWLGVDFAKNSLVVKKVVKVFFSGPPGVVFQYDMRSYLMLQPFSATQEVSGKAIEIFHYCRAVQLSKHFF